LTGSALALLAAYLLGSLPTAAIVARRKRGGDIRERGSGNPGATNVLRVFGWRTALPVLVVDVAKGAIAAAWLPGRAAPSEWLPYAVGAAAIVGHLWPVWARFRGGKGVATTAGVVLVLMPGVGVVLLACFAAVLTWTRRVAAASLVAIAGLLPAAYLVAVWTGNRPGAAEIGFSVLTGLLVIAAHRENIARLRSGTEPRLRWKR